MSSRYRLLREVGGHALAQGCALLLSAGLMLATAAAMGPERFGIWSGMLALSALCMPIASLRLDTRLAVASSAEMARMLVTAALAACLAFALLGLLLAVLISPWCSPLTLALIASVAALTCATETLIAASAYQGMLAQVRWLRFGRLVLPALGAWLVSLWMPGWQETMLGWAGGLLLALTAGLGMWGWVRPSWSALRCSWREHRQGLRASLWMGQLNAVWLNGLLPVLNLLGLSMLAGQYAVVQRLLGAPLGVLGMAIGTTLLREGDALHRSARRMRRLAALLACAATVLAVLLWFGLFVQRWLLVPMQWRMPPGLFVGAVIFLGSSFAVGSISVAAIRLKDEPFLAVWQTVALAGWCIGIWLAPTPDGFTGLLLWGALAYWALLWRWTYVAKRTYG